MDVGSLAAAGKGAGERLVLIVERDGQARELESRLLREAGLRVDVAPDGESALEKARALHPDLVVSEILIPKLDGLALCRQLKSEPSTAGIPVLVISVLAAASRARHAGADGFLLKPLSQERLLGEVARLVPTSPRTATGGERA
jgi:two-component system response regulator MprA